MPTVKQVAQRAGVSPMTVSRVVNGSRRVSPETRERVEQAITTLGYVPNHLARDLSRQKSGSLALVVPDVANPFFTLIVRGAEQVARRADYRVFLCNTESDLSTEEQYLKDMLAHRVAGMLIAPVNDQSRKNLRLLQQQGIPYVLIDRSIPGTEADIVQGNSLDGARQLVRHLIDHGHKRIAMISSEPNVSTVRDRQEGYRMALQDAGIQWDEDLVVTTPTHDVAGGRIGVQVLLAHSPRPTAIFAVNNLTGLGAAAALREQGLSIPREMALVCFDDVEQASLLDPFLTVMAQPAETFGTIATQLLLDRVNGRAPDRRRVVMLPADLVLRESCGGGHGGGQAALRR